MFLGKGDLRELTSRTRPSAQLRCLHRMGIPAAVRADGTVAVLSSTVDAILGPTQRRRPRSAEPNWDVLDNAKEAKP